MELILDIIVLIYIYIYLYIVIYFLILFWKCSSGELRIDNIPAKYESGNFSGIPRSEKRLGIVTKIPKPQGDNRLENAFLGTY